MDQPPSAKAFSLPPGVFICLLLGIILALFLVRAASLPHRPSPPAIVINEFLAVNGTGIKDEDGDHSDWIELYNPGTNRVNLEGWYLTDNFRALRKWRFPSVQMTPGGYLLVFASEKDRRNPASELHTNFKLKDHGEYLALVRPDGQTVAHDFFPKYPRQRANVSYGLKVADNSSSGLPEPSSQDHCYFQTPTPRGANRGELRGLIGNVEFNHASGFYESGFALRLSSPTRGAQIYYTTNGATPSPTNAILYNKSIPIQTTTVVRAAAFEPGFAPTTAEARTYVFPADVVKQTGDGFPRNWGDREGWTVPAHYRMAGEIVNDPAYQQTLREGLLSIPSVSIVTDLTNLFDPATGIYLNPMTNGVAWERPASVEMIDPDGHRGFQVNCGLRIQGGWNRRPEESPKHSLRLLFKKDYGPGKLGFPLFGTNGAVEFDTLILRGGNNNSWLHWNSEERRRGDYLRDEWTRDSLLAMGYPSARGRFVHLYLNGLYWGMYNLCERPSASFVAANEGGSRNDYDSMNAEKSLSGDKAVWNKMMALANSGLSDDRKYEEIQAYLDLPELVDYLILNYYGGNADWDRASNWYAARRRTPAGKYQFFVWDGERTLEGLGVNGMDFDDDESPSRIFHKLSENAEFRVFFGDRVQRLLFNGGPLTPEPAARRYQSLVSQIETAIVAESARWGSYRRDVHQYKVGPFEAYTPNGNWRPEVNRIMTEYFPQRPAAVLNQFRQRGLYPRIDAPLGQRAKSGLVLNVTEGAVYYTVGGDDPRLPGGNLSPRAIRYSQPIKVLPGQKLKIRAATGTGNTMEWSALVEF
jgi:hypothetical protein